MKSLHQFPCADSVPDHSISWPRETQTLDAATLPRGLAEIWRSCGAFEWVTFAYLAWMNVVLAVFHRNVAHAAMYIVVHVWLCLGIICLAWAAAHSNNPVLRFARSWYPLPLYIGFFEELGGLVHMIFPAWLDRWLIQFDYGFAGVHPYLWLARFSGPAMNEFMQFAYMTYFFQRPWRTTRCTSSRFCSPSRALTIRSRRSKRSHPRVAISRPQLFSSNAWRASTAPHSRLRTWPVPWLPFSPPIAAGDGSSGFACRFSRACASPLFMAAITMLQMCSPESP